MELMRQTNVEPPDQLAWLEQAAVLATSLVWTAVVLLVITFVWAYRDAQARWELLSHQPTPVPVALYPPGALPASSGLSSGESFASLPTDTPSPTATPAPTRSPTPTPTYVLGPAGLPPEILPETPLEGQSPSIPASSEPTVTQTPSSPATPVSAAGTASPPTSTPPAPTPTATFTPVPPDPPPATGQPTRLVIRSVGIDTPVVPVGWSIIERNGQQFSVWDVADYAAGWHQTSALPGQPGNTVLAGHHNIKGEVFRYLVDVQEGDEVDLYVGDTVYRYYVEQKLIVKEKGEPLEVRRRNAQWIAPTNDVRVTLVTCWPYTNNTHRVIVVAKPRS